MRPIYSAIPRGAIKAPLPDTTQGTGYSCGPASLMAIAHYYGFLRDGEQAFIKAADHVGMDHRVGAHAKHIKQVARRLGLTVEEHENMTLAELKSALRLGRPVMIMMQAWTDKKIRKREKLHELYRDGWKEGHWIVAIGFDRSCIYFEDPSLEAIRGYLTNEELEDRWHDTGPHGVHVEHYGLVIYRKGDSDKGYYKQAQHID